MRKIRLWPLVCGAVALLAILAHSPLVIPPDIIEPTIASVPRTLWAGIVIVLSIAALVVVGGFVHPARGSEEQDEP